MRRTTLAAALTAAALALTGCGSSDTSTAAGHDRADVTFASQMIPHHAQALQMADMTIGHPGASRRLVQLADRVRAAQQPEIDTMERWLRQWGQKVPQTGYGTGDSHNHHEGMAGMPGMHDGAARMPGMMSDAEMKALAKAGPATFEDRWLAMMIAHHRGALAMARTEIAHGESPAAVALARRVIRAQQAEIDLMRSMR